MIAGVAASMIAWFAVRGRGPEGPGSMCHARETRTTRPRSARVAARTWGAHNHPRRCPILFDGNIRTTRRACVKDALLHKDEQARDSHGAGQPCSVASASMPACLPEQLLWIRAGASPSEGKRVAHAPACIGACGPHASSRSSPTPALRRSDLEPRPHETARRCVMPSSRAGASRRRETRSVRRRRPRPAARL